MLVDTKKDMCLLTSVCILKLGGARMGRPKGGKNKEWSTKEKHRIVLRVENGEDTQLAIANQEGVFRTQLQRWVRSYREKGIEGLKNQKKPGNPLVKFQSKKNLTEFEKLQYENMKLRIENERLKKGYTNEEAMSIRRKKS
jgi:transposase